MTDHVRNGYGKASAQKYCTVFRQRKTTTKAGMVRSAMTENENRKRNEV
jgi:hypothetical protein